MRFDLNTLSVSTTAAQNGIDNLPTDPAVIDHLIALSDVLEAMYNQLGGFQVVSAYRNPEVNALVGGVETSLHMTGQAADILPYMSVDEYFGKIVNSEFRSQLGEIINKAEQGALHVSLPVPGKLGLLMTREEGVYRALTPSEIAQYTGTEETPSSLPEGPSLPVVAGAALLLAAGFFAVALAKRQQRFA
jgi:hypothetical protein